MNKHTKTAFMVAPILVVIGYIAADYYAQGQAEKPKVIQLVPVENCDVINQECIKSVFNYRIKNKCLYKCILLLWQKRTYHFHIFHS